MQNAVRSFLPLLILPLSLGAQLPAIRDLPRGMSLGKYQPIGDVIELPSGTVLVGERETGTIWQVAPGKARGEMVALSGAQGPFGGLALAGGERAYTFSTRALIAYAFGLDGALGRPIGDAPEGPAMFLGSGAGALIRVDSAGRVYQLERDPSGSSTLVSTGPGGGKRTEGTIRGEAIPRMTIGPGGASPVRILQPADGWTVRTDGAVAIVRAEPYRVEWFQGGKRRVEGPIIPYDRVPTTTADSTAWVEQRNRATARLPIRVGGSEGGGPTAVMPAVKPPFQPTLVRTAPDGSLWVGLHGPAGATQMVWDHFDEQGRLQERVRLPQGYLARGFGRGAIYAGNGDGELFRVPLTP